MIKSFKCSHTQLLFETGKTRLWTSVQNVAERKLTMLDSAVTADSLRNPPGNRFESLSGDREGQYSIRINDKWRVCFEWPEDEDGPHNVEIVDYH